MFYYYSHLFQLNAGWFYNGSREPAQVSHHSKQDGSSRAEEGEAGTEASGRALITVCFSSHMGGWGVLERGSYPSDWWCRSRQAGTIVIFPVNIERPRTRTRLPSAYFITAWTVNTNIYIFKNLAWHCKQKPLLSIYQINATSSLRSLVFSNDIPSFPLKGRKIMWSSNVKL